MDGATPYPYQIKIALHHRTSLTIGDTCPYLSSVSRSEYTLYYRLVQLELIGLL